MRNINIYNFLKRRYSKTIFMVDS